MILRNKKEKRPYKIGIGGRIAIGFSVLFFIIAIVVGGIVQLINVERYFSEYANRSNNEARIVAQLVDAEEVINYYNTGIRDARYDVVFERLLTVLNSTTNEDMLFILVPEEDGVVVIFGLSGDESFRPSLGTVYPRDEADETIILPSVLKGEGSTGVNLLKHNDGIFKLCSWAPIYDDGGNVVAFVEIESEVSAVLNRFLNQTLRHPFIYSIAIFSILLLVVMHMIRKLVTKPVTILTDYVASYRNGKFAEKRKPIKGNHEITYLASSFDEMIGKMNDYVKASNEAAKETEHIETELGIARRIQYSMLNSEFPEAEEYSLYAFMNPAAYIGGDFYDFFLLDEDHLAMVIADVSGGSVSGAMFMMRAMTNIKNWTKMLADPAKILSEVNNELCTHNDEGMFVTAWIGILTISTGEVLCANAGHEYPMIKRKDGKFEFLKDDHGLVLGGFPDMVYSNYTIELKNGDVLFVYTDGVPECLNENEEQFGEDRMLINVNENSKDTPNVIIGDMFDALTQFMGKRPQYDDITMLCIKYNGRE